MIDLNDVRVFLAVAQQGGFSRAARTLGMPVSTVSRKVAELERTLGATLVQRTTRKLALTAQGRDYLDRCSEPIERLDDAEAVLTRAQREPRGLLRISVPVTLGDPLFLAFLSGFVRRYPEVKLDLMITNTFVDLIAENVDVAIRFGTLGTSSLVSRRLGAHARHLVAAPAYLARRDPPRVPAELETHDCVVFGGIANETMWELVSSKRHVRIRVTGPIASHDLRSVAYFTERGHGIALLPSSYCDAQIARRQLIRLLPRWSSPEVAVHAVYPTRRFLPERTHAFLEELRAWSSPFWA